MTAPEIRIDCSSVDGVVRHLTMLELKLEVMVLTRELAFQRRMARLWRWIAYSGLSFGALLGLLIASSLDAHAAVRVPLAWTQPDTADGAGLTRALEARVRHQDGTADPLSLWAESLGTAAPPVAPPRAIQRAWALVSEDWRAGGSMLQVRGCNGAGCAPWSNVYVVAAGVPDTVWVLQRADVDRGGWSNPIGDAWSRRAQGRVAWALQPADTVVAASIAHFETIQRAHRARLCELFGYWCLRGARQSCAEPPAGVRVPKARATRGSLGR